MDTLQLKELASRVRDWLAFASIKIGHNQSLDLVAALAGLRNWPEVSAFPQRVARSQLDGAAAMRLAHRLQRQHGLSSTPAQLLAVLEPTACRGLDRSALGIWPAGPIPGVYLTTSAGAIAALVNQYEDATDGALFFAERAAASHEAAIDLGEDGLWSKGLSRVPSGTLIVVGPVLFDQEQWDDSSARLERACLQAVEGGHRVAVLIDTPAPEHLHADATLMITSRRDDNIHEAIVGSVTENGRLEPANIVRSWPAPMTVRPSATVDALPESVVAPVRAAIGARTSGLLVFGSTVGGTTNSAADLIVGGLALTEHAGPAARILPRHRGELKKFSQVPKALLQLPVLPSVQSAYAQGYRRFLVDPFYISGSAVAPFIGDSLFLCGCYAVDADSALALGERLLDSLHKRDQVQLLIAVLTVASLAEDGEPPVVVDLYAPPCNVNGHPMGEESMDGYVHARRSMKMEEQLDFLLASGTITHASIGALSGGRLRERLQSMLARGAAP